MKLRPSLFWDTDPAKLDLKQHTAYIIERVLDFGRDTEVRWLWRTFPHQTIQSTITTSRSLKPATKSLWQLLLKDRA